MLFTFYKKTCNIWPIEIPVIYMFYINNGNYALKILKYYNLLIKQNNTVMDEIKYITEEKRKALEEELNYLKTTKRKEILEALEAARALGDLSENAEYHQSREDQGKMEDRINQIDHMLKSAVVVKKHKSDKVEIGTTVIVKKENLKETITYYIVGAEEADMVKNKISNKSPLGGALFGKKKGDVVSISTPKGLVKYTLVDIQ